LQLTEIKMAGDISRSRSETTWEAIMPTMTDIHNLVDDLHSRKILNADTTLREAVSVNTGHVTSRGEEAGWYVLGGEHYVVVCGMTDLAGKVANPAIATRGAARPGG
jgi:hypothetical protein